MQIGSKVHKERFCQSFMDSHLKYEPEQLAFPHLDTAQLAMLKGIPLWQKARDTERKAGILVSAYAEWVDDPVIRAAIALQGQEEARHAQLIQTLIDRYGIEVGAPAAIELTSNVELTFTNFGFEECLDSFFAFGLFGIAHASGLLPEQLFTIFDPILHEEARHIVFFVNWFTYMQVERGWGFPSLRAAKTFWHYRTALLHLIEAFKESDTSGTGFTATSASSFDLDLTPERFLIVCLQENEKRMSQFDSRLLQPKLLPRLANIALRPLQLSPKRKLAACQS